jgi:cytochrome c553
MAQARVGSMKAECCSGHDATSILSRLHDRDSAAIVRMISMTRLQLLGMAAATALFATAGVHAEGDKAAGKKLIYTCAGCHGVPGYSNAYPQYPVPKIAGQNEQYIINALHGYQSGDRTHPTMGAQAQSLSDTDIQNVAAYLSSLAQ